MLATLFLIGSALAGACAVRRAWRGALAVWEALLWGTVAGWMLSAVLVYGLARAQGRLTWAAVACGTAVAWLVAAVLIAPELVRLRRAEGSGWRARLKESLGLREPLALRSLIRREHVGLALVLALFAPVYWRLFSTHTFAAGAGGVYSGGSAWYDLSFHAALATSFAYGANFPPAYTPMSGEPLLYPFMPDFHAAALLAAGLGLRAAMLSTALPLALSVTGLFYSFALRLTRSAAASVLATLLFLLNGGLGFWEFVRDWRASGLGLAEFWDSTAVNYANLWGRGLHWTNLVADTLVPQRASLYGLPAALMIFTVFAVVWQRSEPPAVEDGTDPAALVEGMTTPPGGVRLLLVAGVLAGLLPYFHTHTYVAVGLVSVFLFLLRPRREWFAFWAPAVVLALPQLYALAQHAAGARVVRLQPGWMGADAPSFAVYMLRNFGVTLLLAVPAWLAAPRVWKRFYVAFLLLFAFALVVVVSPNVFDNGKLTYYWHAVNAVFVARWLLTLVRARRLSGSAFVVRAAVFAGVCVLVFLSVATGLLALRGEAQASALLFTDEELKAASFMREKTEPHAVFLTAPVFNQPALCLAGRSVVRGATAWLWGHGYEFRAREADVRRIYAGGAEALELLRYYGVDYVYLGEAERRELKADAGFFASSFDAVYSGAGVSVYDVRGLHANAQENGGSRARPAPRELAARVGRDPFALVEEFPRVSFFVYRLFKVARGRAPRRDEFMEALKVFGRGLYVGAAGWETQLGERRRALAVQFADGDAARADELLRAAEDAALYKADYDTSYVLVHFFGYLGRDPGTPPDRDLTGFDFWRDVLRRNGDYRSLSRAFLESEEYKNRAVGP
ncbi:MAG TPA: hypothetical protein VJ866_09165 [Pyrinomonadaceae bacterium]|nr:hypothetical protein [Pyrinomonadaceae bacterium]